MEILALLAFVIATMVFLFLAYLLAAIACEEAFPQGPTGVLLWGGLVALLLSTAAGFIGYAAAETVLDNPWHGALFAGIATLLVAVIPPIEQTRSGPERARCMREMSARVGRMSPWLFARLDTNGDGIVTEADLDLALSSFHDLSAEDREVLDHIKCNLDRVGHVIDSQVVVAPTAGMCSGMPTGGPAVVTLFTYGVSLVDTRSYVQRCAARYRRW